MAKQTLELDEDEIALALYDWVNRNYPHYRAVEGKFLVKPFRRRITSIIVVEPVEDQKENQSENRI